MAMTRKHYSLVANMVYRLRDEELVRNKAEAIAYIEGYMSAMFEGDNPRFDEEKFLKWCREGE